MAAGKLAAILCLAALAGCTAAPSGKAPGQAPLASARPDPAANTIPLDDSYTVSQRYFENRAAHPEISMPAVALAEGGQILFDRRYKLTSHRELHADVFLPAAAQANGQALVLIHGGAWRSGNKSNFYAMAALLARRGYAVVLPEFRLSPEARYPAGLVDINDAISWVRSNATDFRIDPDRIAIGGESSGGQMASLIAYTGGTTLFTADGTAAPRVNALIDIDGVLDFTSPLGVRFENAAGESSVAALWLGGSLETAPDRWKEASAASHVGAGSPPTLIISGEADRFTAGRETVMAALARNDIAARHVHFAGMPHTFWLFDPYLGQVVDAIDGFIRTEIRATAEK
ncbi:alpha/beta hydrolase [Croceicoccus ponticola]|uniref:Alpha/beta hydrolase n=2 Tax=Croceicoccus ponticola TaxID=2217664 RepID=A0A437GZM8_9SPHN|nr:alpha/beta hydrolase [Croceicoccus ponticola]